MDFANAATYFDNDAIFDAYTDEFLFTARTTAHDDHTSSGSTSRRRTLIAPVDAILPARRAIRWYDSHWLVGGDNADGFGGQEVRRNFGLKKSSGLMTRMTAGGVLQPNPFHAHKEYFRDMTDALTSSDMDVMWNVFCPMGEPIAKSGFLTQGDTVFKIRNVYQSADDFLVAEADQLDVDALQSAIFTGPAAMEFTTGAAPGTTTVAVIQTDASKFYQFRSEGEAGTKPGDRVLFVLRTAFNPVVGGFVRMLGLNWHIVTRVTEGDAWALKIRAV